MLRPLRPCPRIHTLSCFIFSSSPCSILQGTTEALLVKVIQIYLAFSADILVASVFSFRAYPNANRDRDSSPKEGRVEDPVNICTRPVDALAPDVVCQPPLVVSMSLRLPTDLRLMILSFEAFVGGTTRNVDCHRRQFQCDVPAPSGGPP